MTAPVIAVVIVRAVVFLFFVIIVLAAIMAREAIFVMALSLETMFGTLIPLWFGLRVLREGGRRSGAGRD